MTGRFYQAYGQSYALRPNCELTAEDYRRLSTLAKLEKQLCETRKGLGQAISESVDGSPIIPNNVGGKGVRTDIQKTIDALTRQELRIKRVRQELKETLA